MGRRGEQLEMPDLYAFEDYRAYLRAWYKAAKSTRRGFSYRSFSAKAGFRTSNFLLLVMTGRRNLTQQSADRMCRGLGLNKQEQEFFHNLVFMNQAKTTEEKRSYFERILQSKQYRERKPIEQQHYQYYSQWYHPVVRELVCSSAFDGTPAWLSHRLYPHVTPAQCAKSIELLENLELIARTDTGRWEQSSTILSTGARLTSLIVHNYHKVILDLAKTLMDRLSAKDRDISTMTMGIATGRLPELQAKVEQFRKEVIALVSNDDNPCEVAQLSIQLFPLTRNSDR
jgi:uncharacterized protein (TIGR02147 family)